MQKARKAISQEKRELYIQALDSSIARMKYTRLLAERNDTLVWQNRLLRLYRYGWKYLIFLLAKIKPFAWPAGTFFNERLFVTMPEQYYFLMWGFFPEIDQDSETNLTKFFINNLKEGDVFFDVGANCGFYSVLAGRFVGSKGQVHSFEPTRSTFQLLKRNKELFENMKINNVAVSNTNDYTDFFIGEFSVENSVKVPSDLRRYHKSKVQTISLDEYCKANNVTPDFIKIDVEGSEEKVIDGAQEILSQSTPIVSMEIWKEDNQVYVNAFKTLISLGYTPYLINRAGDLVSVPIDESFKSYFKDNDLKLYENLLFKK